ncbi:MAG TPA: cytochrome c-type biogenesis protein [Tahibacter sp.]|nr:cytochrome c-type biogenesis protein [Tahibacter sp.]
MIARIAFFLFGLAAAFVAHAVEPLPFKDAAEEQRFQHLARELRCLVCQNQNLADSDAGLAKDLRNEVFEQLRAGKSDDEIKDYLVARYSEFVLYDPPLKASTLILWFGPFVLLAVGGVAVWFAVRKRAAPDAAPNRAAGEEEDW